jgi:hypothetical protein
MATFKRKSDPSRYPFIDSNCIGRECWAPGLAENKTPCCLTRLSGCPEGPVGGLPEVDPQLTAQRKAEGWRQAGF